MPEKKKLKEGEAKKAVGGNLDDLLNQLSPGSYAREKPPGNNADIFRNTPNEWNGSKNSAQE